MRGFFRSWAAVYRGLPLGVWLQAAAGLINRSGTMVLPFFALYLTRDRGLGTAQAGQLLGLYGLGGIAGSYVGGWLCDRWGAVRVEVVTLLLFGAGLLAIPAIHDLRLLAVAMPLLALVGEGFRPALLTAVGEESPPELRSRSMALVRFAINLGMSVGPAVGGLLASYSYLWLFVADAGTCWLAAIFLVVVVLPRASGRGRVAMPAGIAPRSPWADRPFLAFMLLVMVQATVFFQLLGTFPLYLREVLHLEEARIGAAIGVNAAVITFVEMPLVKAAEAFPPIRLIALGAALVCLGFGLLPLAAGLPAVVATVLVWTLGEMLSMPQTNALVSRRAGAAAGRYRGVYTLAWAIAFVIAPAVGTEVYARWGGGVVWIGCAALALPLALGFLAVGRHLDRGDAAVERPPASAATG